MHKNTVAQTQEEKHTLINLTFPYQSASHAPTTEVKSKYFNLLLNLQCSFSKSTFSCWLHVTPRIIGGYCLQKNKGFCEVKSRKFVIEQTPRSLPSNLFRGHVEKIEKSQKTQILARLDKTFGIKRCQRYFLMNFHLTASSEGVNCI